jgi:aminoglycoside phosphotransferase (APT) family kinase protein
MASPHQLEPVCDAAGPGEAHIIASMLREAGIEAFVFDTAAQTLQWDAPRIINPYLVHVQHADLEQARKLITSNREASVDLDWDEVDVGEPIDELGIASAANNEDEHEPGWFWPMTWKNLHRWFFVGLLAIGALGLLTELIDAFLNMP